MVACRKEGDSPDLGNNEQVHHCNLITRRSLIHASLPQVAGWLDKLPGCNPVTVDTNTATNGMRGNAMLRLA